MKMVNIQAAKTHLSRLVEEAVAGEEIILAKAGQPMGRLTPFSFDKAPRKLGMLKGQIHEAPGCWDPRPASKAAFQGHPVIPTESSQPQNCAPPPTPSSGL